MAAADFSKVRDTVLGRCSMCHAREPGWEGIVVPPKGVILESDGDIVEHAREIYLQAGRSHAMPPANVTGVTEEERQLLATWYETAVKEGTIQ
ncbi:putative membrane protein [Sinorhizobium fredii]